MASFSDEGGKRERSGGVQPGGWRSAVSHVMIIIELNLKLD